MPSLDGQNQDILPPDHNKGQTAFGIEASGMLWGSVECCSSTVCVGAATKPKSTTIQGGLSFSVSISQPTNLSLLCTSSYPRVGIRQVWENQSHMEQTLLTPAAMSICGVTAAAKDF